VSEESFGIVPGLLGINARSPEGYKTRGINMKIDFSIKIISETWINHKFIVAPN
jgi:hypothetical protein